MCVYIILYDTHNSPVYWSLGGHYSPNLNPKNFTNSSLYTHPLSHFFPPLSPLSFIFSPLSLSLSVFTTLSNLYKNPNFFFTLSNQEDRESMGKYMRKAKVTSDIAVMELSQSSLGVKTRAKTLALQKLEAANIIQDSSCYLQLRNRRLEKTNDAVKTQKSGTCKQNPEGNLKVLEGKSRRLISGSVGSESGRSEKNEKVCENGRNEEVGCFDLGVEASFGENNLEFDARERS